MNTLKTLKRTERAKRNLALKLMLERRFLPEIRKYFKIIERDFTLFYSTTGRVLSKRSYGLDTVSLLRKQYKRVSNSFGVEMRDSALKEYIPNVFETKQEDQEEIEALIAAALALFEEKSPQKRSEFINETNQKEINEATNEAIQTLEQEGDEVSNVAIAFLASSIIRKKFAKRVDTIALTETQFSSERVKAIEAGIIAEGLGADIIAITDAIVLPSTQGKKQWAAILDEVTRLNHAIADGQRRRIDEPFNVGGELLRHPGDTSLNASAGNVINCRCSALYTL